MESHFLYLVHKKYLCPYYLVPLVCFVVILFRTKTKPKQTNCLVLNAKNMLTSFFWVIEWNIHHQQFISGQLDDYNTMNHGVDLELSSSLCPSATAAHQCDCILLLTILHPTTLLKGEKKMKKLKLSSRSLLAIENQLNDKMTPHTQSPALAPAASLVANSLL